MRMHSSSYGPAPTCSRGPMSSRNLREQGLLGSNSRHFSAPTINLAGANGLHIS